MSNVVAVPHIGSATHETRYNMMACAVDNLIDALQENREELRQSAGGGITLQAR